MPGGRQRRDTFVGSLKLEHQLNQLFPAQALQISAIHPPRDSEIGVRGKGLGNYTARCYEAALASGGEIRIASLL